MGTTEMVVNNSLELREPQTSHSQVPIIKSLQDQLHSLQQYYDNQSRRGYLYTFYTDRQSNLGTSTKRLLYAQKYFEQLGLKAYLSNTWEPDLLYSFIYFFKNLLSFEGLTVNLLLRHITAHICECQPSYLCLVNKPPDREFSFSFLNFIFLIFQFLFIIMYVIYFYLKKKKSYRCRINS